MDSNHHHQKKIKRKKKINKTFELVRGKISNKRIIFLQETHPSEDTLLNKWWEDSKREVLFLTELQIHAV